VTAPARVILIGTGLIGTSVALALRERGTEVWLSDADEATARLAADLGAGTVVPDLRDAKGLADVAVLAVPPAAVAKTPGASACAPVYAPRRTPNSSLSASDSLMVLQWTVINGLTRRLGSSWWMAWTSTCFPVPVSPSMRTVMSLTYAAL